MFAKNVITCGVDNSSVHADNKKKDILILVKNPTNYTFTALTL